MNMPIDIQMHIYFLSEDPAMRRGRREGGRGMSRESFCFNYTTTSLTCLQLTPARSDNNKYKQSGKLFLVLFRSFTKICEEKRGNFTMVVSLPFDLDIRVAGWFLLRLISSIFYYTYFQCFFCYCLFLNFKCVCVNIFFRSPVSINTYILVEIIW